jgi:hypothetical protein
MTSGHLLGFIVSTTGIMVDPLKVEASLVASTVHSPLASMFTGKRELFTMFHRKLSQDHKGIYVFTEEGCSFSLG